MYRHHWRRDEPIRVYLHAVSIMISTSIFDYLADQTHAARLDCP